MEAADDLNLKFDTFKDFFLFSLYNRCCDGLNEVILSLILVLRGIQ